MEQSDISDQALHKLKIRAAGNRTYPVSEDDVDDLVSALTELEERRQFEKGAPFMSKSGDWVLAIILLAVLVYAGYLAWSNWA
jgi:hypothetical protein